MTPQRLPARPKILVVRLSALGDVVMASGLIPALHARYPGASIAWLTEPAAAPLLAHNPRLDAVIVWPRAHWTRLWRERRFGALQGAVADFRAELRSRRFDLALDAQGLLKSALGAWLAGAPRRVGLLPREGGQWLATEALEPARPADAPIGWEYRALAEHLGAPPEAFRLDLVIGASARQRAAEQLTARGAGQAPVAGLCPFTTRPQKHWFEDRWAALATQLHRDGFMPVLLGGPADAPAAARIAAAAQQALNLAGQLALDESVAVIGASRLLVGVDTGLTHAGTALRIPTVALFGSTRPYTRTDSGRTAILFEPLACAPCRRNPTCDGRFDCMRALTVERVLGQARAMLAA